MVAEFAVELFVIPPGAGRLGVGLPGWLAASVVIFIVEL